MTRNWTGNPLRAPICTIVFGLALAAAMAVAQDAPGSNADRSVTYAVSSVDGSGLEGSVFIGEYASRTIVVVALHGTEAGANHPAHFHAGDCGSGGGIEVPLANVDGTTGLSVTRTDAAFDMIATSDLYLNVHQSPQAIDVIVACGEVGQGAEATSQANVSAMGGSAAQETEREEAAGQPDDEPMAQAGQTATEQQFGAPETASYGLFEVEGSGINGQLQLTERVEGGTTFVVTLVGIEAGNRYALELYEGDCGPDRPRVRELNPVGGFENDPYVSITETDLNFRQIANGDYFLYVFHSEDAERVAACGEVGQGANR